MRISSVSVLGALAIAYSPMVMAEAAAPASDDPTKIALVCDGSTIVGGGYFGGPRVPRNYRVEVRIAEGKGQIFLPATNDYSGTAGEWLPIKDLRLRLDAITGRIKTGLLGATSQFSIDRHTGTITTSGGYSGECKKVDLTERAF